MAYKDDDQRRECDKRYQRRRRAARPFLSLAQINSRLEDLGFSQAAPSAKKPSGPSLVSLSDPDVERELEHRLYDDWRQAS